MKWLKQGMEHGGASSERDVANLGLVRPPLVYLISLVSGVAIQLGVPLPFLPRNACCAARSASRSALHGTVLLLSREIPGSRHARSCPKTYRCDRSHGPVSLQPKPDLFGVFLVPTWYGDLAQQCVVANYARRGGRANALGRHTEGRALPGAEIRRAVLGL